MILISHLRRAQGDKGHEDGASVSLGQLRGSHSIAQLSDLVVALERDISNGDNRSCLKVLKNRFNGQTGPAGNLAYNPRPAACRPLSSIPDSTRQLPMTTSRQHAVLFTKEKCKPCCSPRSFIYDLLEQLLSARGPSPQEGEPQRPGRGLRLNSTQPS